MALSSSLGGTFIGISEAFKCGVGGKRSNASSTMMGSQKQKLTSGWDCAEVYDTKVLGEPSLREVMSYLLHIGTELGHQAVTLDRLAASQERIEDKMVLLSMGQQSIFQRVSLVTESQQRQEEGVSRQGRSSSLENSRAASALCGNSWKCGTAEFICVDSPAADVVPQRSLVAHETIATSSLAELDRTHRSSCSTASTTPSPLPGGIVIPHCVGIGFSAETGGELLETPEEMAARPVENRTLSQETFVNADGRSSGRSSRDTGGCEIWGSSGELAAKPEEIRTASEAIIAQSRTRSYSQSSRNTSRTTSRGQAFETIVNPKESKSASDMEAASASSYSAPLPGLAYHKVPL